jgi:hypothetical protein
MRYSLLVIIVAVMSVGCAHTDQNPLVPVEERGLSSPHPAALPAERDGPYRLWWEGLFYIDAAHERVDVVPRRDMHLHLNALKFLEEYCKNCLQITSILNNGDGTIDLTVRITHPFPGLPQYTGFDVKGIIMFQGSHEIPDNLSKLPLYPQNYRLSWRLIGDPEVLNADGYTYRWSPWYDSGSGLPVFNYWPGKYSKGTPTANINGYLNFYSNEERHMFECDASVSRTYHIWLPPGPITAGYAIDACWVPPVNTPVTNPIEDFPITANQPEAYYFKVVINDGQPIQDGSCCNNGYPSVYEARAEFDFWYFLPEASSARMVGAWCEEINLQKIGFGTETCDSPDPDHWRCMVNHTFKDHPNGTYQLVGWESHVLVGPGVPLPYPAFDVFEVVVDID